MDRRDGAARMVNPSASHDFSDAVFSSSAIDHLRAEVERLRDSLSLAASPEVIREVDHAMGVLSRQVKDARSEARRAETTSTAITETLTTRLDGLRESIESLRVADPSVALGAAVAALARKLDLIDAKAVDPVTVVRLQLQTAELKDLVSRSLAHAAATSEQVRQEAAEQLAAAGANAVEAVAAASADFGRMAAAALTRIEGRLEQHLARAPATAGDSDDLAPLRERLDQLSRDVQALAPTTDGRLAERIDQLLDRLDHGGGIEASALAPLVDVLERHLVTLTQRMGESHVRLGRLDGIEGLLQRLTREMQAMRHGGADVSQAAEEADVAAADPSAPAAEDPAPLLAREALALIPWETEVTEPIIDHDPAAAPDDAPIDPAADAGASADVSDDADWQLLAASDEAAEEAPQAAAHSAEDIEVFAWSDDAGAFEVEHVEDAQPGHHLADERRHLAAPQNAADDADERVTVAALAAWPVAPAAEGAVAMVAEASPPFVADPRPLAHDAVAIWQVPTHGDPLNRERPAATTARRPADAKRAPRDPQTYAAPPYAPQPKAPRRETMSAWHVAALEAELLQPIAEDEAPRVRLDWVSAANRAEDREKNARIARKRRSARRIKTAVRLGAVAAAVALLAVATVKLTLRDGGGFGLQALVSAPLSANTTSPAPVDTALLATLPPPVGPAALKTAALAGDADAACEVGVRYADGRGTDVDTAAAMKWLAFAAAHGSVPAAYRLGSLYEYGTRNLVEAKRLYQWAAERGNLRAMHNLGVLYSDGVDGKPDWANAVTWFRQAAERGLRDSQYNLGVIYGRGLGGAVDRAEAFKWFSLAANQGDTDSARKRDDVANKAEGGVVDRAKAAVSSFVPGPVIEAANSVPVKPEWEVASPADAAPRKSASRS